ncbi:hypothetical protein ABFS83_13G028400 [Erythranthe nasuta]
MEKQARYCSPNSSSSAPRIERKITEKNRRNRMKLLSSNLTSLLPHHTSKIEGLPVPDQMDEAVEYIKSMKTKLEEMSRKKDSLKLPRNEYCDQDQTTTSIEKTPLVEVHNMGPNIDVVLAKGLKDFSTFHDIIRMLHRHEVEVASASFARCGDSTIQILQDNNNNKDGQCRLGFGREEILRKVEELVCGVNSSTEIHSHSNLWDYEIESNIYLRIN